MIYGFLETLDYTQYVPNKFAFKYFVALKRYSIDVESDFELIDFNIIKKINLCSNALDKYEKFNKNKIYKQFAKNLDRFGVNGLIKLMDKIKNNENYVLLYANELFCVLINDDILEFKDAFNYYKNNKFELFNRPYFIKKLFDCNISALEIYNLLNENEPIEKDKFNGEFFLELPEQEITSQLFEKFIDYLNHPATGNFIFYDLNQYLKYNEWFLKLKDDMKLSTSNIIQYLTKILIDKSKDMPIKFNHDFCELYGEYFKDNFELLKEFYFNNKTSDSHYDYNFKELSVMCSIEKCFLEEYLQWAIPNDDTLRYESLDMGMVRGKNLRNENYKLTFIWELDYTYEELEDIISYFIDNSHLATLSIFFSKTGDKEYEFIKEFISKNYENKKYMRRIFEAIDKCYLLDEYISFLKSLLELNQDVEVFRNVLNPKSGIKLISDESGGVESKLDFYKAIKKEIPIKEEYMPHIILLRELIDEYEIK